MNKFKSYIFITVSFVIGTGTACAVENDTESSISKRYVVAHGDAQETADSVMMALNESMQDLTFSATIAKAYELMPYYPHGTAAGTVIDIYLYQCYSFFNERDSVDKYASYAASCISKIEHPFILQMYYNLKGVEAMANELNYAMALYWFEKCIQVGMTDSCYLVTPLANICHIYYLRKDPAGIRYARQAYEAMSQDVNNTASAYYKVLSRIIMAQMSLLSNDFAMAKDCLSEAETLSDKFEINVNNMLIAVVYADLFVKQGNLHKALQSLEGGFRYEKYAESWMKAYSYLEYGKILETLEQYSVALTMYDSGLETLTKSHSMEFKSDLLAAKADLLLRMGNFKESAEVSLEYYSLMEKIVYIKEREFEYEINTRIMTENMNRILEQGLAINRIKRIVAVIIAVVVILFAIAIFFYISYRNKLRLYKMSVFKTKVSIVPPDTADVSSFETFVQPDILPVASGDKRSVDDTIRKVFERIEQLMQEGYYRNKDLNMDMLAEKLGTNRTYVSKAINRFSGLSFWQFLDSYRISYAIGKIKASGQEIVFKSLSEEAGYSSPSVFSRAFRKALGMTPEDYVKDMCKA